MKNILIIDESSLFKDYLKLKLEENGLDVSIGINAVDGITKMKNIVPDLIIMDTNLSRQGYMEVLRQKKTSPNTINIPVILLTQRMAQSELIETIPYKVKQVFTKPLKIDMLFRTLSQLLGLPLTIDESPGIIDVHINDNIMLIEVAQGLNNDKIDLLRFKITELIKLYDIRIPKIIIMISDISLSFSDSHNLRKLLETVIKTAKVKNRNIRILTNDAFTRQFIINHAEFANIEVESNLKNAIDGLLNGVITDFASENSKIEIIQEKILSGTRGLNNEALHMKFDTDSEKTPLAWEEIKNSIRNLHIASIDENTEMQELLETSFYDLDVELKTYKKGVDFFAAIEKHGEEFDLVFLNMQMENDGFQILTTLNRKSLNIPVIVISTITNRDIMLRAYKMGIKSYLVKPIKPEDIQRKAMEIYQTQY